MKRLLSEDDVFQMIKRHANQPIPTAKEIFGTLSWKKRLEESKPTYMENWPIALNRLSVSQIDIPLTRQEALSLGATNIELGEDIYFHSEGPPVVEGLLEKLSAAVEKFPGGAFVRLGSRSPKDNYYWIKDIPRVDSGEEALQILTAGSERIHDDLRLALVNEYLPHIFVRQYVDIPEWSEFRCFMKNRKLIGISQYLYRHGAFPEIEKRKESLQWAIEMFFQQYFEPACSHLDDVIFDVFVKFHEQVNNSQKTLEVKLLEINPFGILSDPCLFDWNQPEMFDGRFEYCRKESV